jgi:16S rRNA (guanine966-N2)-methyltransferase
MAEHSGSVRIITGRWRGRRLRFPAIEGLRPTSDRRRETLFNWLGADLSGQCCLDLFAGSGALGFEAASRGADCVVLVEASRKVARALERSRTDLAADTIAIHTLPAARYLQRPPGSFDIVFIDPPFARPTLAEEILPVLDGQWLAPGAHVYLEVDARREPPIIPPGWQLHREMTGGDAHGLLYVTADAKES